MVFQPQVACQSASQKGIIPAANDQGRHASLRIHSTGRNSLPILVKAGVGKPLEIEWSHMLKFWHVHEGPMPIESLNIRQGLHGCTELTQRCLVTCHPPLYFWQGKGS